MAIQQMEMTVDRNLNELFLSTRCKTSARRLRKHQLESPGKSIDLAAWNRPVTCQKAQDLCQVHLLELPHERHLA